MKKSIFKNTIYKSLLSFVNIVVPLLVGPYIVRLLDVGLYGTYNKVLANFQLFLTFASFGIYTFGIREISKIRNDKEKVSQLLSNLFLISIITNFITIVFYVIFALKTSNGITTNLYLLMIIQIVANIFYIEYVNEALENYSFITIKTIIVKLIYVGSLFLLVHKPNDIIIYTIIINGTVLLNNLISFIYAKKRIKFDFKKIKFKKYISPLITILIISNVDLLYSQLDRVMLGNFVNDVSVTLYYIPYYILSTLAAIPYSIINVSIPRLSYLIENEGKENYEIMLNKSLSSLLFIIVPICFGVFVLAKEVVVLYAGEKYLVIIPVLMVASIIRIIISIESTMTNLVMYPNNQENKILKYTMTFGILNFILNGILVILGKFNPLNAMITTGIAEIGLSGSLYFYIKNHLKIKYKLFSKINLIYFLLSILFIPISLIVRGFSLEFWLTMIIIVFTCIFLYVGVLFVIKDENLVLIINKVLGKLGVKI